MALEYFQFLDCPIQNQSKPVAFMRKAKVRGALSMLEERRDELESMGKKFEDVEVNMPYKVKIGMLRGKSNPTVKQLRALWNKTEAKVRDICPDCPVNIRQCLLGCYGAINYPISEAGERWLLDSFNPPQGDEGYIAHHLRSGHVTGEQADSMRPDVFGAGGGPTLLEASESCSKRIGEDDEISSSQLIEYIFACQPFIHPMTLFGLCVDFRLVEMSEEEITKINGYLAVETMVGPKILEGGLDRDWRKTATEDVALSMPDDPNDDATISAFKDFFRACWHSFREMSVIFLDG